MPENSKAYAAAEEKIDFCIEKRTTVLNISELGLTSLPKSMADATHLEEVNISVNQLRKVPDWLTKFTGLKKLSLFANNLTQLPGNIGNLKALKILNMNDNLFVRLPESFSRLQRLSHLMIMGNHWEEGTPTVIRHLPCLSNLQLSGSHVTSLPGWLTELRQLRQLQVPASRLSEFPAVLRHVPSLLELCLDGNQISTIPDWISDLTNLRTLFINFNELNDIPKAILDMPDLHLRIDGNPLNPELLAASKSKMDGIRNYLRKT